MTTTMNLNLRFQQLLLLSFFCLAALAGTAQTIYTGPLEGSWGEPSNWSNGLPGPGNDANIFGVATVKVDAPLTVDFTVNSFGSIVVEAPLTNEGSILSSGSLILRAGGDLTNKNDLKTFGNSSFLAGSSFVNEAGASFINSGPLTAGSTLVNRGLATNNGSIDATNGAVHSEGIFDNNQQFTVLDLDISQGSTFTNNFGAVLNIVGPAGNFSLEGTVTNFGQINNNGNMSVSGLLINAVMVDNKGQLIISADGQINNTGTFYTEGSFTNDGSFTNGFRFQNAGIAANHAQFFNNNQIENLAGGTFTGGTMSLLQGGFGSLLANAGDFVNKGNLLTPGTIRNEGNFENEGIITLPSGSNFDNQADFFNLGTIQSNNTMNNEGLLGNAGTILINAGSIFTNFATVENYPTGMMTVNQELVNKPSGHFINNGTLANRVRMFLEGTTTNNGSFDNKGDLFVLPGGLLVNTEVLLQASGNLSNEGNLINTNSLIIDECSSLKNLGDMDNQQLIENKGIFIQRGALTGNNIANNGGYVHTAAGDEAPALCNDLSVSANVDGLVKVYTNSFIAFTNFDSCANILYFGNGLPLNIYDCEDIGTVIPVQVAIKTRLNDELTCTALLTPLDLLSPVFSGCPANMDILTQNDEVPVNWPEPTALDNCTSVELTPDFSPGSLFPVGVTTVTYSATDGYGNLNQCQFQVNVVKTPPADDCEGDTEPPVIVNCPGAQTVVADFPFAAVSWTEPTFLDACQPLMVMVSKEPGSNFPIGETVVVYTVKDGNNNATTCEFLVTVVQNDPCETDTQSPDFIQCPQNISLTQNPVINGAVANWTVPGATDDCLLLNITSTHNPGEIFQVGSTTVTYTATDAAGNTGTCSFNVQVNPILPCSGDVTPPVISGCPAAINLTTVNGSAVASWAPPTASDDCQPVNLFSNRQPGTLFQVGVTPVIYTASDGVGNQSFCSFNVTVTNLCLSDITPPTISGCPNDMEVGTAGSSAPATWAPPTATDNCTLASFATSYLPGALFPLGETTVTYKAKDANGNQSTCAFVVKVVDNVPPVALCQPAFLFLDETGNGTVEAANIDAGSFDPNGIASRELDRTGFDCTDTGPVTVTLTVKDTYGNAATCNAVVLVMDGLPPAIVCPTNITACEGEVVTYPAPSATDNCGALIVQTDGSGFVSGDIFPTGPTILTFTALDAQSNMASCSFEVNVLPVPAISLLSSPCSGFCQGAVELTAQADSYLAIQWSNGETGPSILAAPGDYQVTVTHDNGCKNTASTAVAPISRTEIPAYTILAQDEVHVHKNTVLSGGVGVWNTGKTAKIHDNSTVSAFVQAPKPEIDKNSSAGETFEEQAPDPTLFFFHKTNPKPASNDTVIIEGVTAHIYGNDFEKIEIKQGATAIFYANEDIMAKEFKVSDSKANNPARVIFIHPVDVVVKKKFEMGKHSIVNENGPAVTFHLTEDNAVVKESATFHANIYAPNKEIKVHDATEQKPTEMVGLFIAKKVDAKKFVNWYQKTPAPPAPQLLSFAEQLVFNAYQEPGGLRVSLDWATNTEYKNELFVVEKSLDGRGFEPMLQVHSTGHDDRTNIYRNYDPGPQEGANFYRLKVTYTDGSHAYSPVRQVWLHFDPEALLVFPNPASDWVSVYRKNGEGKAATIKITGSAGLPLLESRFDALPGSPVKLDLNGLKTGTYLLSVKIEGHREVTRQIVVVRE